MHSPNPVDEEGLLTAWADVLQTDDVGLDDDFLDMGGDSLVALALISRIAGEFGVELDVWELLDAGTPRRVLETIAAARNAPRTG